ncbi:flagellar hook-length control protein FliK [Corallococcus exiguus]|uniref:flagellar hook-length control protein FliK n=1 Tax=Corallococcus TaxID=83461 RepID=UPI000ED7F1EF|nr:MULTISPECIES: flagellar hook-length control protein FliK [Corallococcus]NNB89298.1 flagellar hook-length control protein FliK [Corallococcus exiguus]NNC00085.1 flagellar hook-length control protein FliK [Corallococcus exiguus]NNC06890.1 flagellar hook-length control protein FliK [Corallococcus exiguus]NPC50683.1 flagellar hook-length control protein FliK [Corallococcus exiguus]RKH77795.1 flagellar hook-length control protein FliK [Corallococcus sp. AB032C]
MSRVDDDRDAARLAERMIQERKLAETKTQKRLQGESVFSKLVQQGQAEQALPKQAQELKQPLGKQVLARLAQGQGKTFDEKLAQKETAFAKPGESTQGAQQSQRNSESQGLSKGGEARKSEVVEEKRSTDVREGDMNKAEGQAGRLSQEKGELKIDVNAGGGKGAGGGGSKEKDDKGAQMAGAGFRFNPALMAPVPVAKPKDTAGSERLRAMANEIAQKIVERVRVGTNAAGNAEFQIDLRGDVLNGLSIKVSAKNGKISAVFSGNDRDTLKMLEEQSDGLRSALGGRGLALENLRFEAKT